MQVKYASLRELTVDSAHVLCKYIEYHLSNMHCRCTVHLLVHLQCTINMGNALHDALELSTVRQVHTSVHLQNTAVLIAVSGGRAVHTSHQVHHFMIL